MGGDTAKRLSIINSLNRLSVKYHRAKKKPPKARRLMEIRKELHGIIEGMESDESAALMRAIASELRKGREPLPDFLVQSELTLIKKRRE